MGNNNHLSKQVWAKGLWGNEEYWAETWKEERRRSLFGRQRPETTGSEWWGQRAEGFTKQTGGEHSRDKQVKILQMLEKRGLIRPGDEVLDIGCGPGNYALPLAKKVKKVVALDPAEEMLNILKEKAVDAGVDNLETVRLLWEDVNLDCLDWRGRFELVFASKTPGINDVPTLKKMIAASNHGCFLGSIIWREDRAFKELWRVLFQEDIPPLPADLFNIFHLLYAWGFTPALETKRYHTREEMVPSAAIKGLTVLISAYLDCTVEVERHIERVVSKFTVNGSFIQERHTVEGNLTWTV